MTGFDAIIAGAGIWGCTIARRLADAGGRVLVLEQREAVGGNVRCRIDHDTGIEVHLYGSLPLSTCAVQTSPSYLVQPLRSSAPVITAPSFSCER